MDRPLEIVELLNHAGWLRRLAGSLVRDDASADDLVQDTWVAAMRRPPRSGARPWLTRVMQNLVRNERRMGASRAAREEFAQEEREMPSPEEILQEAEAQRLLAESVANLAEPLRAVIVLHYFRGLDSKATARELGLSASAVRTRLQKALAGLRAELDGRVEGGRRAWSLALGALVRGARMGTPAGAASVAGSAATMVSAPSMQALPWVGGVLLLVGGGLAAWMIADDRETPALEEMYAADRVASNTPEAETELEPARGEPVAQRAPIAMHGHERARFAEPSLYFDGEVLVDGRAPEEEELFLAVDGWEEGLGEEGSEEEHHMVRSTREFLVRGAGYFGLGPLPLDWSGSLRVRDHVFENGQESMPLAGPSRELVLRLQSASAIAGRLVDPLGHPVGNQSFEQWVETSDGGSPVSGGTRRGRCDAEGRFRIPVARQGTIRAALLFDVPGRWRRLVKVPPFPGERGIDLGDVALEPATAQRFRLLDSFGGPVSGGAVLVAPGDLGKVSSTDFEGFGVLPSLERSGAEVCFFAPRHDEKVMNLLPSELAEVQLERTSSLDVRFVSTVASLGILNVVITADQEIFSRTSPDGGAPAVRTGSDWSVCKTSPPGGRDPVLELHYTITPGKFLALNDLRPGVPFQLEVKDEHGRSLDVRSACVARGEWQDLEIRVQPGP